MRLSAGSTLGPYEISGPIGAGGMGEVYRARDTRLGREVAIKVLPPEVTADPQRLARFEREARSASALNHPNIVTIHDFTSRDGETWLVMELVRGESLRELLARGALPLKKLLPIATGIADGLAAAHAAGIVHRDLKPENVMVTSDGTAKILDFGLVKSVVIDHETNLPTDLQVSRAGVILGTAAYMSPEQARGQSVDFRSDQFSLGLILYEMATGKHPFPRPTSFETLSAILNEDPPPLDDSLPPRFNEIVERCLAKNPAERFGSTMDLAHDLRKIVSGTAALRPVVGAKPAVLGKWAVLIAIAILAVAAGALLMQRPQRGQAIASMQLPVAAPEIAQVSFGAVMPPVAISPDGRYLLINGTGTDNNRRLWLYDFRSGVTRALVTENANGIAWSPDSRSIVYSGLGKLKTISVEGGPPRILCDVHPPGIPTWSGDTILFAQGSEAPGIFRVSAGGGKPQRILSPDASRQEASFLWPQFLPDGKHFLAVSLIRRGDELPKHELLAGSLDGGPPKRLGPIESSVRFASGHLLFVRDGTLLAQPFDPKALRFEGQPRALLEGLHYFVSNGMAAFSVSDNGLLVWRTARRPSRQVWLDRGGVEIRSLGNGIFAGGRLSPDGRRYAAGLIDPKLGVSDIWIYDLTREHAERLIFQRSNEMTPVWTPDGRTIYYGSDGPGAADILRWKLGEDHGTPVYRKTGFQQPQDVSPDGKWLLFDQFYLAKGNDVLVLPLEPAGTPREFAATPFNETSPRFSPDGRWVAYVSDQSGEAEVYVKRFEGSATTVRISKDGGSHPRWSPDGRELFYLSGDRRLMVVPVRFSGTEFEPGTVRMLFQVANLSDFEVAPDGSRFLAQLEEPSPAPAVQLLINWPSRLSR